MTNMGAEPFSTISDKYFFSIEMADGQTLKQYNARIENIRSDNSREQAKIEDANSAIKESRRNIERNNYTSRAVDQRISQLQETEKQYASAYKNMGMDGKTFGSAQEFKEQLTHNTRMMKNASYREFQAGKYDGVMTPSQRTQFERQIRTREAWKEVGAGLGKAAGIGAAAAVAVGSGMIAGLSGDSDFGAVTAQASFSKNAKSFGEYGSKAGGSLMNGSRWVGRNLGEEVGVLKEEGVLH